MLTQKKIKILTTVLIIIIIAILISALVSVLQQRSYPVGSLKSDQSTVINSAKNGHFTFETESIVFRNGVATTSGYYNGLPSYYTDSKGVTQQTSPLPIEYDFAAATSGKLQQSSNLISVAIFYRKISIPSTSTDQQPPIQLLVAAYATSTSYLAPADGFPGFLINPKSPNQFTNTVKSVTLTSGILSINLQDGSLLKYNFIPNVGFVPEQQ